MIRLLCVVTGGAGDQIRARRLTRCLRAQIEYLDVDRSLPRVQTGALIARALRSGRWDLIYQEGSGIASGLNLIRASLGGRQRYLISSGDPIGSYFRVTRGSISGSILGLYERLLYRHCFAFVGWTPYLTGMAMTLGAPRALTIEGGVDLEFFRPLGLSDRRVMKQHYGLAPDHLICGLVGSLNWSRRQGYCYGLELIQTLQLLSRQDVSLLIVGDGDGRQRLAERIPSHLCSRVVLTGRLPRGEIASAINAMDVAFNPQTVDCLGSYRLTQKLPEYLACAVPVAMSPIPGFYDYVARAGWALPADHPATPAFARRCAAWLDHLTWDEVVEKGREARGVAQQYFDYNLLSHRFAHFIESSLA
jgi:glycosyltransferase involved in cell wall biosynthesis